MVIGAVSQIEVDQGLIGDAFCVGQRLEVVDGAAVDVDGDLLFQPVRVGVTCFQGDFHIWCQRRM